MNWRDIPIFITNFCNLDRGFHSLLLWLQRAGMTSVTVIDNASGYSPLLDFYDSTEFRHLGVRLARSSTNLGHEAFWRLDLHKQQSGPFIVTDPDVVPDPDCPLDLVRKMLEIAERYHPAKVGPAIRIDNLPASFALRDHMRFCESDYWLRRYPEGDCWNAAIDTTFAVYQPGWERWPLAATGGVPHVRLDFPYVVEHRPWYSDSANPTEEERYYLAHALPEFSSSLPALEAAR